MYEHEVKAGMKWLDEHYPNWRSKISLPVIMDHPCKCILGQAIGKCYLGANLSTEEMIKYGFEVEEWEDQSEWNLLQLAWEKELAKV